MKPEIKGTVTLVTHIGKGEGCWCVTTRAGWLVVDPLRTSWAQRYIHNTHTLITHLYI